MVDRSAVQRSAKAGQLTLNYYDTGVPPDGEADALPLVMLHGGGPGASAWSNFGPALDHFAPRFRTLAVDQPGFGDSDKPPVEGNYYRFSAEHVVAWMDEIGLDKVHLLGNSLGGGTAMRLALSHPERVGKLVLMGPGGLSLNLFHADPTEGVQRLMEFSGNPTPDALRAFISTMVVDQSLVTDELVQMRFAAATAPGAQEAMKSMGWSFFNPETAEDGMLWREAHRLRKPVLLTWGREDRVNPLDGALAALKLLPRGELHVFPNCGHWAQIEAAEEFAAITTEFLTRRRKP
ncbi:4,5:9,10-diseco-3-hydroxy-5,9,17-trioxoandrosta-1(10),2-diene-4-oate hydrolase [Nocardioides limicola]|uniref:4,5:9,10-diseco-3-hydroxy-5,9, 17-trioxoandrosta-1(10),2-diene-4-oate hydrolase n=1 Tax=Nocardioides limicola TaxID=2803368 RepID=UPI00193B9BBC|nr:4,5:9,10-diseco-3-hydroxy-5,9,17-trioxoandrosta-1(10),2-diene-4-oate hydrolase [Nocardioides sp. DJM-14]